MGTVKTKFNVQKLQNSAKFHVQNYNDPAQVKGAIGALISGSYPHLKVRPTDIGSGFTVIINGNIVAIEVPIDDNDSSFDVIKLKQVLGI